MHAIFEIDSSRKAPKYLQIVHSVTKSIKLGKLKNGDRLLSINKLSNEFLLARDTVQKAYNILEEDGILVPVKGKGFYINKTDTTAHYLVGDYAAVYRDFVNAIISVLEDGCHLLRKYNRLVLVYPEAPKYPAEIVTAFTTFCLKNSFRYAVLNKIDTQLQICKDEAYLVIEEKDLVTLIKQCQSKALQPGEHVGIISYNDTPLKELLLGGITVISIDHNKMNKPPIKRLPQNKKERSLNPFSLIIRKSL